MKNISKDLFHNIASQSIKVKSFLIKSYSKSRFHNHPVSTEPWWGRWWWRWRWWRRWRGCRIWTAFSVSLVSRFLWFSHARGPSVPALELCQCPSTKEWLGLLCAIAQCIQTSPTPPPHLPASHTSPLHRDWLNRWPLAGYMAGSRSPPLPPVPLLDHGADPQPQALIHRYTTRAGQVQLTQPQLQASIVF